MPPPLISRAASLTLSRLPKRRRASRTALSGVMPLLMFSCARIMRWKRSSASISSSTCSLRSRALSRSRMNLSQYIPHTSSGRPHHLENGVRQPAPVLLFDLKLLPARLCELVELGPQVVLRRAPLGRNPPLPLDAVERGVERALFHPQHVVGHQDDTLPDSVPVQRTDRERLQDEHVERALQQLCVGRGHV